MATKEGKELAHLMQTRLVDSGLGIDKEFNPFMRDPPGEADAEMRELWPVFWDKFGENFKRWALKEYGKIAPKVRIVCLAHNAARYDHHHLIRYLVRKERHIEVVKTQLGIL